MLQADNFAKGRGNLQLFVKMELEKQGIECDDASKAQSILFSINNPMKNPASRAKVGASKIGALNYNYKVDKWSTDEITQLRELCEVGYNISKIAGIMKSSRRLVHNKILDLQIRVKSKGEYQLLTKMY